MAARKKATVNDRTELLEALDELEKEKQISKNTENPIISK